MYRYAVFDLDGTLGPSDTFLEFLVRLFVQSPLRWPRSPLLAWSVILYFSGRRDNSWLKATFLRHLLGGRRADSLTRFCDRYVDRLVRRWVFADGIAEIDRLRDADLRIVLATASPDVYVRPLARELGIDEIICTQVEQSPDGRWTGGFVDGNCYGEAKRSAIDCLLKNDRASWSEVIFYSDHISDFPCLSAAGNAIVVNPTPRFRQVCEQRGLKVVLWK